MMHRHSRLIWGAGLALAFCVAVVACDTTEPDVKGTVQGRVLVDAAPLPDVTVELNGPTSQVATSDAEGRFSFADVPTGAYVVSIRDVPSDAAFQATSRTAVLSGDGTVSVNFDGNFIRTASVSGRVSSREQGLAGVTVQLVGPDSVSTQTSASGAYGFSALRSGVYRVEISGFPGSVSFPSVSREVALGAGEDRVADFQGTPELTATAVIRSVRQVLPSGETEPAELDDLQGRIEVEVGLEPGEDTVDSIQVLLGEQVIGTQRFQQGDGIQAMETDEWAANRQDIVVSVNTARFDSTTAMPRFRNGEQPLLVRLASREGGPEAWVSSTQVRLNNPDSFLATLIPGSGPITGEDGKSWVGGDLQLRLDPIMYSPDRQISTVTVEIRRSGGLEIARRSAGGTPPFLVTFPAAGDGSGSLADYQTAQGAIDRVRVLAASYSGGQGGVPALPRVVLDSLRIDQRAPDADFVRLPSQGAAADCCRENWVGAAFPFASVVMGLTDTGVGGTQLRVHAGPAELGDAALLATNPVTLGSELQETATNTAYRALVVFRDALGNERVRPLEPTSTNPATGSNGARFGIDLTPPQLALDTSENGLSPNETNPPSGSRWILGVGSPGPSGLGPLPARTFVQRTSLEGAGGVTCLFPGSTGLCDAAPDGLSRAFSPEGPGLYRYEAFVVDQAGNRSNVVVSEVLLETAAALAAGSLVAPRIPLTGSTLRPSGGRPK